MSERLLVLGHPRTPQEARNQLYGMRTTDEITIHVDIYCACLSLQVFIACEFSFRRSIAGQEPVTYNTVLPPSRSVTLSNETNLSRPWLVFLPSREGGALKSSKREAMRLDLRLGGVGHHTSRVIMEMCVPKPLKLLEVNLCRVIDCHLLQRLCHIPTVERLGKGIKES